MKDELRTMTEEWKRLERKTNKQREVAENFYEKKLMKLIEEEFIEKNKEKLYEKIDYLIMSVGTSYEPLVLDILLLKPKRILFLYTKKTEKTLDKIVKHCHLEMTMISKREVHETDPIDVYREIKGAYLRWNKPEKVYIDFTGGTKAMSAAAAMAGAMINVQLIYLGTEDYLSDFRKPNPGTEMLYYISNPLEIFGDLEIEKAFALFDRYNYSGARERLADLKERVPDPGIRQQLNFVYYLAKTYEAWDTLEFPLAYQSIQILTKELERDKRLNGKFLMMDFLDTLRKQEQILKPLSQLPTMIQQKKNMDILTQKEYIVPLMFTMYTNAGIREFQEKYDMATLLLYRLLEMIEQRRLSTYNLYISQMDYQHVQYNVEREPVFKDIPPEQSLRILKEKVFSIKKELFKHVGSNYLPDQISLLEGFILLLALNDQISENKIGKPTDKLKRIRSMVYLRNNSIFAHGLGPVPYEDYKKFKNFVSEIFKEFCDIEGINFDEYKHQITFLNPLHSENYTGMEGC